LDFHNYEVGDLVIILQNLEWDEVFAIQGEIGIVAEIYEPNDEEMFFDLGIQLADGGVLPVWLPEVERLVYEP
jgi:hypothetical protein